MASRIVEHNIKNLFFFIRLADKNQAILEYKKLPNQILELYHTEVPKEFGGKGIAKDLVKVNFCKIKISLIFKKQFQGAFRYCIDNNYKIYPTCSYVQKYSKDLATEEEKKIVVNDLKQIFLTFICTYIYPLFLQNLLRRLKNIMPKNLIN